MNDIDIKLREKIKMLDDIDKMVKNEPKFSQFKQETNISFNQSIDRHSYSNHNLFNEIDLPLQNNNKRSNNSTRIVKPIDQGKLNNISGNFSNYYLEKNKVGENNYYSIYGNNAISTKEVTEQFTIKNKKKLKLREGDNSQDIGGTSPRSLISSRSLKSSKPSSVTTSKITKNSTKKDQNVLSKENVNIHNFNTGNENEKSPNKVGERLYNYGFYIKEKIEKKRDKNERYRLGQMTPEISSKAKSIRRDPKKFHERLYPTHKLGHNNNFGGEVNYNDLNLNVDSKNTIQNSNSNYDDNTKNNSFNNIYREEENVVNRIYRKPVPCSNYNNFEHKPHLDKNSLKIAEKLPSSKIRLLSKRSKKKGESQSRSTTPSKTSRNHTPTNRTNEMYQRGLDLIKKKEVEHKQKKVNEDEEFKNYPYKPKIISHSPVVNSRNAKKTAVKETTTEEERKKNFYDKNIHWKKKVDTKTERLKQMNESEMNDVYTFKPKIQKSISPNDEKFINKNLSQIENYVNRRRNIIQKNKEDEEYKRKRFISGENYKCKMTVPKEFNLRTENRANSREGIRDNFNSKATNSPNNINASREKFKTNEFFENSNQYVTIPVNQYYSNLASNYNKCNNYPNETDEGMNVFMNAVNNLHQQIVNFKI